MNELITLNLKFEIKPIQLLNWIYKINSTKITLSNFNLYVNHDILSCLSAKNFFQCHLSINSIQKTHILSGEN